MMGLGLLCSALFLVVCWAWWSPKEVGEWAAKFMRAYDSNR